jgi:RimJ/RimL family protein N-acetyltransferase
MPSSIMTEARSRVVVRAAAPADGPALLAAIAAIDRETEFLGAPDERPPWADAPAAHLSALQASGDGAFFVAVEGDAIVGYLGAAAPRVASCRGAIYIFAIGLRRSHRGRFIGGRLLDAVENWARARGAWRLDLRVVVENARALALYRRHGFEIEGRMTDAFRIDGAPHDNYWMAKPLDDDGPSPAPPIDLALGRAPYPPAVALRPLRAGDGAALQRFERSLLDGPPVFLKAAHEAADGAELERQVAATLGDRRCHVLVATDGQQRIVGHGGIWRQPAARLAHDATCRVSVLRPWWGCGIGRALAERLEAWAAAQGLARLTATVLAHNRRGLRFAAARGFGQEVVSRGYARLGAHAADRIHLMRPVG